MTPTMRMARDEREEFAALLLGLSPQQWESPTLCEKWRVRDVVAHVIGYDPLNRLQLMRRMAKGGRPRSSPRSCTIMPNRRD